MLSTMRKNKMNINEENNNFINTNKIIIKSCIITFFICLILGFIFTSYIFHTIKEKYDTDILELTEYSSYLKDKYETEEQLNSAASIHIELLESKLAETENKLSIYEERSELFDKYEIAILNTNGTRTSLTYDDIKYIEEICEQYNVPASLVFYIMKVESNFTPDAKSSYSTATGLMQIIESTGESIHYNILGKTEPYDHSIQLDVRTNALYAIAYLDYLLDRNDGDIDKTLMGYSGGYSEFGIGRLYHQKLENNMELFNESIETIQIDYEKNNN